MFTTWNQSLAEVVYEYIMVRFNLVFTAEWRKVGSWCLCKRNYIVKLIWIKKNRTDKNNKYQYIYKINEQN